MAGVPPAPSEGRALRRASAAQLCAFAGVVAASG
jgi:hypothetical protein